MKKTVARKTKGKSKKQSVLDRTINRFQSLSHVWQIAIVGLIFAGLGGGYYLHRSNASDGIPTGANQLVISYDIGMPHSYPEDNFPNAMPSAILLYGNGLMLCNTDSLHAVNGMSEEMSMVNSVNAWRERHLSRAEVQALVSSIRAGGFDKALAVPWTADKPIPVVEGGKFIRVNTDIGADKISFYPGDADNGFAAAESILKAECNKTTVAFDPDDVYADTITLTATSPDAVQATVELPSEVEVDPTPTQGKVKRVTGKEAKALKTKMAKEPKVYKKDGQAVRARLVTKVPDYDEPRIRKVSSKGKVYAAGDFKTRWLIVVGAGQSVPDWATNSQLSADVTNIRNYYNGQLGKTFDSPTITVVRSHLTPGQLRTCPADLNSDGTRKYNCGDKAQNPRWYAMYATHYNLQKEFHVANYSTVMFTAFDATYVSGKPAMCVGLGEQPSTPDGKMVWTVSGTTYSYPLVAQQGVVATINGGAGNDSGSCDTYKERRNVAAHEFGHNTSLWHISDGSLMNPTANPSNWPNMPINASQASILRNSSLFFNSTAPVRTPEPAPAPTWQTSLGIGAVLTAGQQLKSPDGGIRLVMQTDGNLVLYNRLNHVTWAVKGTGAVQLALQTDSNVVMRNGAGTAVWASNTKGSGGNLFRVQDDGNVVLYGPSGAVWSSHTAGTATK